MMKHRFKIKKSSYILFALCLVPLISFAQTIEEQKLDEVKQDTTQPKKFIVLTLGVEQEYKLPPMPEEISFKGTFKKFANAAYSKETNAIRFTPVKEGKDGTLTIHDKHGRMLVDIRIEVKQSKLDAVVREIQSLLGDIEGIQIKIVNNKVVVDGQVLLPRDMNRIYNVISQFGDQASSLVTLSPLAQKKIAEFISRDINNPEIEVRAVNDKFILQGIANNQEEKDRAEVIAKTYVPSLILEKSEIDGVVKRPKPTNDGVINLITIKPAAPPPPGKIIQLVVHYVELKKDYAKGFRFQFTPTLDDQSGVTFRTGSREPGGVTSEITGVINNLLPKLNWAKNHGHARVLESTSMIVQDGKTGTIKAVSEIPIQTVTKDGASTQFKEVGISSTITPALMGERSDSLTLDVQFDVSALTGVDVAGPRISKNFITTSIIVRSGQSAAIGGLIRNTTNTGYNNPDGVPANPIISLYASKNFQRNQSQFVVFLTPIIKSSASAGSEQIKKKFRLRD